jgi:ribosomal protein S6
MNKKVTEEISTSEVAPRVYEVSFWLVPTISESELPEHFDRLKKVISDAKGEFVSEEAPYSREMTYEMVRVINNVNKRFNEGYFGWVKFKLTPESISLVKSAFENDITVIRSLVIETVEENTTYTKRPESKFVATEDALDEVEDIAEVVAEAEILPVVETPVLED